LKIKKKATQVARPSLHQLRKRRYIWHFYNQCLFNSFRQVIWLECESKVSL
jgi:hypothetical protein